MKYIKTYEDYEDFKDLKLKDLKKYLLLKSERGKLFIFEKIKISFSELFGEQVITVLEIYDSENGFVSINKPNLEFRFTTIIKSLVKHSNNVSELIEIAKRKLTQNRYNL